MKFLILIPSQLKIIAQFTIEDGLANNQEDDLGNIWFGNNGSELFQYDGNSLTNFTTKDVLTDNAVNTILKDKNGELWFGTDSKGICKFTGTTFTEFKFN